MRASLAIVVLVALAGRGGSHRQGVAGSARSLRDGARLPSPSLDLQSTVTPEGGGPGVLAVTPAPDSRRCGKLYVYLTSCLRGAVRRLVPEAG